MANGWSSRSRLRHAASGRLESGAPARADVASTPLGMLPPERLPERALILLNLGMARWYRGDLAEAQTMLASAQSAASASGDAYAWLTAAIFLNQDQLAAGLLHPAATRFEEILRESKPLGMASLAHYDLGGCIMNGTSWRPQPPARSKESG